MATCLWCYGITAVSQLLWIFGEIRREALVSFKIFYGHLKLICRNTFLVHILSNTREHLPRQTFTYVSRCFFNAVCSGWLLYFQIVLIFEPGV